MIVNKANITAIFIGLKTVFNQAFAGAATTWQEYAMLIPSTTSQENYAWLSAFPKMRKWLGDKVIKSLSAFGYTLVNDDYEATVEVDRNHIDDDQIGIYKPMAQDAGSSAKQWPDEMCGAVVNGSFVNKCYDGQYFCDTDHPVGDGAGGVASVSNKGVAVLTIVSQEAAKASYGAARTAMRKFKDDDGRPLGVRPTVLMVPPALEDTALSLMSAERLEDGKVNIYRNTAKVVVNDQLTSDTAWFLLDCSRPVKPFVFQQRKKPVFVQQTDPEADGVFMRKKYIFGAESRGAAGYALWQLCYGSTGAGE
jgi:phage major head subunit gpT-like protein